MPFGLTNAPSTFQSLMNSIFDQYLRKFILVFFNDILVYSSNWVEHLEHLQKTFEVLRSRRLYVRRDRCSFGQQQIAYLGHVIKQGEVVMDPLKISANTKLAKAHYNQTTERFPWPYWLLQEIHQRVWQNH